VTIAGRDTPRPARAARLMRGRLLPWLVIALDAASVAASWIASDSYFSYAMTFSNDCGRTVGVPAHLAVIMWLALAVAVAGVPLTVAWYLRRQRAGGGRWYPVRGWAMVLLGAGLLAVAFCAIAVAQGGYYHVTCTGP
jgi:hypothetical protein